MDKALILGYLIGFGKVVDKQILFFLPFIADEDDVIFGPLTGLGEGYFCATCVSQSALRIAVRTFKVSRAREVLKGKFLEAEICSTHMIPADEDDILFPPFCFAV